MDRSICGRARTVTGRQLWDFRTPDISFVRERLTAGLILLSPIVFHFLPEEGSSMAILRRSVVALAVACFLSLANAQQPGATYTPALDVTAMDRNIDPCVDFFAYSCGGWIKKNPIPADQFSWDTYSKMQDENRSQLRGILEAASVSDAKRNGVDQKIGDYYASCTDEKAIEAKGAAPLHLSLEKIAKISSKAELADAAAALIDDNVLFRFDSIQDFRDAN